MKKGFTMIELIFVIVILGILASVAIPRLAGTRADAEISATIANMRTLISDVGTYYAATGDVATDLKSMTNVKLANVSGLYGELEAGGVSCIEVGVMGGGAIANVVGTNNAFMYFKVSETGENNSVCKAVVSAPAIKNILETKLEGQDLCNTDAFGCIPLSSSSIYEADKNTQSQQKNP